MIATVLFVVFMALWLVTEFPAVKTQFTYGSIFAFLAVATLGWIVLHGHV